jgi:hypothetical protein
MMQRRVVIYEQLAAADTRCSLAGERQRRAGVAVAMDDNRRNVDIGRIVRPVSGAGIASVRPSATLQLCAFQVADRKIQSGECGGLNCTLVWAGAVLDLQARVAGCCHTGQA